MYEESIRLVSFVSFCKQKNELNVSSFEGNSKQRSTDWYHFSSDFAEPQQGR